MKEDEHLDMLKSNAMEADERASELNTCCICLDRYIETVLTCFHAYCRACIDDWKKRDPTCPMCRDGGNGRGSFDLIRGPSGSQNNELKVELMRELANIIESLLGQSVNMNDSVDSGAKN